MFSDTAQSEKATYSVLKSDGFMSPNKLYFLYLQGLVHLVSLKILSKSDDLILSKILPYSLVKDESYGLEFEMCGFNILPVLI